MGIARLKKLLTDDLTRAFTARELRHFIAALDIDIDLYSLTGYPKNSSIPRREAALRVVEYFHKSDRLIPFVTLYLHSAEKGFKGEHIVFNNIKTVIFELSECGYKYNKELRKVVLSESEEKRLDWGYLKTGMVYDFCFLTVDICKNTLMVRKYDADIIRKTYINFKNYVQNIIEPYNGRIWMWEGDGGLVVFHIKDFVNQAVMAGIKILSNMPVFNSLQNYIDDDILIRIAITSGSTEYKKDIVSIDSDIINHVKKIEKDHTTPMSISLTAQTFTHIDIKVRKYLIKTSVNGEEVYQLKLPFYGDKN